MKDTTNEAPVARSEFSRKMDLIRQAYRTQIDDPTARLSDEQWEVMGTMMIVINDLKLGGIYSQFCEQMGDEIVYCHQPREQLAKMDREARRELMEKRIEQCNEFEKNVLAFFTGQPAQD
jgi:hypothetical protein